MTRNKTALISLAALAGLNCTSTALAHGDPHIPLYVAEDGIDSGLCDDARSPCRTIGYAIGKAAKGSTVNVAEGSYAIENTEDLFHLLGDVVNIVGGYRDSGLPGDNERGMSTLTGVPLEFRPLLAKRGFHVIADRKGIDGPRAAAATRMLTLHATLQSGLALETCENGDAGGLPCDDVDLVSHIAFGDVSSNVGAANDVWGFVDLNTHREYVIAGFNNGTGVFDVSDPENPVEIGYVVGQNTTWRDIKVYQFFDDAADRWKAYAYVTTDGAGDGMIVIDLTGLPHFIVKRSYLSDFTAAHNVYLSGTDFTTGISLTGTAPGVIVAGSNLSSGRYRAYSLDNPAAPAFIADAPIPTDRYMHDAASLLIADNRRSACVDSAAAWCDVLLDFNEDTIELWDITNPAAPSQLSSTPYSNSRYVHSGWATEDGQYMLVHDELDEQGLGLATTVRIFSLANLANPQLVGTWSGPTNAIDHNGFVRGNRYYMSNYARGLTVLDITNPALPVEAGRLDTYPFSDGSTFVGAWGAYPFLPSGTIAISDIDSGIYLANDQTRNVAEGQLSFASTSIAAEEGIESLLTVSRSGGTTGAVSVDWEFLDASTDGGEVAVRGGTLSWASGESADKTISIQATDDGEIESMELALIRLQNPTGGATLGNNNIAYVFFSDAGSTSTVAFTSTAIDVAETDGVPAVITVQRRGSAVGAVSVDYALLAGDAQEGINFEGATSGTLDWADGDATPRNLEFTVLDDNQNNPSSFIELALSNASGAALGATTASRLVIEDGAGSNVAPVSNAGASQTLDERTPVTLDGSQSNDPDGTSLEYEWVQTSGAPVAIQDSAAAIATFTAPSVTSDTMMQFQLTVYDVRGASDVATTMVTVINTDPNTGGGGGGGGGGNGGGGGGGVGWLLLIGLASVAMRRRFAAAK